MYPLHTGLPPYGDKYAYSPYPPYVGGQPYGSIPPYSGQSGMQVCQWVTNNASSTKFLYPTQPMKTMSVIPTTPIVTIVL